MKEGLEAYAAVRLEDSSQEPLGHLGVAHDRPIPDELPVETILRIFAARTSSELSRSKLATQREQAETARRAAEAKLEEQRIMALRGDRLRSLGEMAAGMAHELNQPLVGVRGIAEHLLMYVISRLESATLRHLAGGKKLDRRDVEAGLSGSHSDGGELPRQPTGV